jgi:hypothetical protein
MYSARMRLASSVAFNTVSSSGVFMVHASIVRAQKRENEFLSYSRFRRSKRTLFAAAPGSLDVMDAIGSCQLYADGQTTRFLRILHAGSAIDGFSWLLNYWEKVAIRPNALEKLRNDAA